MSYSPDSVHDFNYRHSLPFRRIDVSRLRLKFLEHRRNPSVETSHFFRRQIGYMFHLRPWEMHENIMISRIAGRFARLNIFSRTFNDDFAALAEELRRQYNDDSDDEDDHEEHIWNMHDD